MIHFDHAGVTSADGHIVLEPITLTLTERRIALIGPNGSGKSTFARMINGLAEPAQGTVTVKGLDTVSDGKKVRQKVAFSFTDPGAQLVMPTVLEDVALSLRRVHRNKTAREQAAREALARFGLEKLADRSVHALSGGQRQLVALASVLATDPDILVADEPTTLLDLRNTRLIHETLHSLDMQVIVATHDLDYAARCERALVISDGRVAFDGPAPQAVDFYRANP